ncbi:MAG: nucleotidyltransferase domain-containing protein, partial [Adhaeribacter sp.]
MAQTEAQQLEAETYYRDVLELLNQNGLQYLVGGGWAFRQYTGIVRDLKDLDLFCKAGEYPKILKLFSDHGYKTELSDVRWLAKLYRDDM